MRSAADYLAHIKALIVLNGQVQHWSILNEATEDEIGFFRFRLQLRNGDLLEMFERFYIEMGQPVVTKFSFHWQHADGNLYRRWDSAAHHPELSTFPSHVHEGAENTILPHEPVDAEWVLARLSAETGDPKQG